MTSNYFYLLFNMEFQQIQVYVRQYVYVLNFMHKCVFVFFGWFYLFSFKVERLFD